MKLIVCSYIWEKESKELCQWSVFLSQCVCVCAHSRHPALKAKPPGQGLWRARMRHAQSVPLFKPLSEAYLLPQCCLHGPLHQLVGCDLAPSSGIFFLVSMRCRWRLFCLNISSYYFFNGIITQFTLFYLNFYWQIVSFWRIYLWFSSFFGIVHYILHGISVLFLLPISSFLYAEFHPT